MRNTIATGLFLLAQYVAFSQQFVLNGTVTVFNSQFETGKKQYVVNAQVEEDYGKSQATTTNTEGVFNLPLVGIKDLEKVFFNVKKANYEVVNTDVLQAVAGQKEAVQVYLALEGVIAENKRKYYQINRTASEKAVTEKLVQLGQQIETLQQKKAANQTEIAALQADYARLQESFIKIDKTARELAERYSKTNLDGASEDYQRAFRYFQSGLLDSALFVFQKIDLEQTAQSVLSEQNRTAALKTEYETRNTEKNKQKMQTTEALLFKANLHQAKFEFIKVEETYQLLLRLDSTNINTLWALSDFLASQNKKYEAIYYDEKALTLAKTPESKATTQNNLGLLYHDNQEMPQAEGAFNEALKIYRQLAEKNPNAFLPYVANILNNLASYFSDNQEMPQAEGAYNEALKIRRQLAEKNSADFLHDVAGTLNNLGAYYYANQKMPQSERAYNEALKIYRQLAEKNLDASLPYVAITLNNLGNYYSENQEMPQAERAYNEALKIYRQLAEKNPNAYLPDLAMTLNNLGNYHSENQEMPQAERAYNEALKTFRQLAEKNPDAFLPHLAITLNNLGTYYSDNQKMPQAEGAYNEALKIRRQLAEKNPDAFLPYVAGSLNNLGAYYYTNQKMPQAERDYNEALKIYRQLAQKNPDAFLPDLARTLNNLGAYYYTNQEMQQAERVYNEALKIYRQLAEKNPDAFLPDLAMTLNNLGNYFSDNQKMPQAEKAYNEALKIRRQLAEKNPDAFLPDLAMTLNNLGAYATYQKMPQAEGVYNEALEINKQLAEKNPDVFLPEVAGTLNNLGVFYKTLKHYDKALDYFGEAFGYREDAILKGGTYFFQEWVQVLSNIAEVKDSVEVKKDYTIVVKAGLLLAEGCDKLKDLDEEIKKNAVSEYGSLSWWSLFAKDYALSEKAARRCLELDETQAYVLTNIGHSQILRGQYEAGIATYEKLKGKRDGNNKDYKTVLLEDLQALEKEGVNHPDVAKARKAIEKWRK